MELCVLLRVAGGDQSVFLKSILQNFLRFNVPIPYNEQLCSWMKYERDSGVGPEGPCVAVLTAAFSVWWAGSPMNASLVKGRVKQVWWVHTIERSPAFRSKKWEEHIVIDVELIKHRCDWWGESQNEIENTISLCKLRIRANENVVYRNVSRGKASH